MAINTNLVGYWTLDGDVTDSLGINNGASSNVTFSNSYGKINQGANFVRGSSAMNTQTSTGFPTGNVPFTVSCWSNLRSYNIPGYGAKIFEMGLSVNNVYIVIGNDGVNPTTIAYGTDSANRIYTPASFSLNTWYHYVFTYDGTTASLYINGTLVDSAVKTLTIDASYPRLNFGSNYFNDASTRYDGYLDEFGLWSRCLTATEASYLYNSGNGLAYTAPLFNLVSYYAMEGDANDSLGVNNGTSSNITFGTTYGKINKGALFDASLESPKASIITPTTGMPTGHVPFTMSGWVKLATTPTVGEALVQLGISPNNAFIIIGSVNLIYGTDNASKTVTYSTPVGQWFHLAITYDKTTASLYINGTFFDSQALNLSIDNTYNRLAIGSDYYINDSSRINGSVDEVGIFNACLTASAVASLPKRTFPLLADISSGTVNTKNYIANSISI